MKNINNESQAYIFPYLLGDFFSVQNMPSSTVQRLIKALEIDLRRHSIKVQKTRNS